MFTALFLCTQERSKVEKFTTRFLIKEVSGEVNKIYTMYEVVHAHDLNIDFDIACFYL